MLKAKSFYFVRHGESEHNNRGVCAGGGTDSPLTIKGEAQAHALKIQLSKIKIDQVISSPMIRAKQTAEIAAGYLPLIDENLREIHIGIYEGKQFKEIGDYVVNLPWDVPIPDGESKAFFTAKITEAFNKWLGEYEGNLLFVAHGFVYATLLTIIGKTLLSSDLEPKNAMLIHFFHNGNDWTVLPCK